MDEFQCESFGGPIQYEYEAYMGACTQKDIMAEIH